jgi:hypothetical protein
MECVEYLIAKRKGSDALADRNDLAGCVTAGDTAIDNRATVISLGDHRVAPIQVEPKRRSHTRSLLAKALQRISAARNQRDALFAMPRQEMSTTMRQNPSWSRFHMVV